MFGADERSINKYASYYHESAFIKRMRTYMQRKADGFTLIELIVAIVVAGILMTLAMPSFIQFLKDARLGSQARGMLSDLQYARSEAAKRNQIVALCASEDGENCTDDWSKGRIVFVDDSRDGIHDGEEEILRVSEGAVLPQTLTGPDSGIVFFRSTGQANASSIFTFCDDRTGNFGRTVTIETSGRSDVATSACESGSENDQK